MQARHADPLAVPPRTSGTTGVMMENCTLVLPLQDYAVLLSAALRGAAWKSGAVRTAHVLSGVMNFTVRALSASRAQQLSESRTGEDEEMAH